MENDRVKILLLANHASCVYNLQLDLIRELLQIGYEVIISCLYESCIEELKSLGCSYIEANFNNRGTSVRSDLKLINHYRRILQEINPQVVLTYRIKPTIYGGIATNKENVPFVANITGLGSGVENKGLLQIITVSLYHIAFKKVSCVFFQNKENLEFFKKKKIKLRHTKLLPGSGVNLDKYNLLPYLDSKQISFILIARIMKEKGIDQYLDAASYIKDKYPNTSFHVCGFSEGDYKLKLEIYEQQGIITYHGRVDDIREILKDVHCTIHPSYNEGLSNALLESAAAGRVLIASNIHGCKETIDEGKNGYTFEVKNTLDLIDKIELFLSLPFEKKREMGMHSREKIEKEFDRKIVVQAYMKVIDDIVGAQNLETNLNIKEGRNELIRPSHQ